MIADADRARRLDYWRRRLVGAPSVLGLPSRRARASVRGERRGRLVFDLAPELLGRLDAVATRAEASLSVTLLAAFQALVHRYTAQVDRWIGSTSPSGEMLVVRTDLSDDPSFFELVKRVRRAHEEALAHELPLAEILGALDRKQLFDVAFTMAEREVAPELARGLDLLVRLSETPAGLVGEIDYDAKLFEPTMVAGIAEHYAVLLECVAAGAATRLSVLPLMTVAGRQLLVEWNDTARKYPRELFVRRLTTS